MAKIKTLGKALQLKSSITKEVADEVSAFNSNAFQLKDKEGTPFFKIAFGEGSYSKYGVTFDSYDSNGQLYLMIAMETEEGENITKEDIKKEFASVLYKLKRVEAQVEATYAAIQKMGLSIEDDIELDDEESATPEDTWEAAEPEQTEPEE